MWRCFNSWVLQSSWLVSHKQRWRYNSQSVFHVSLWLEQTIRRGSCCSGQFGMQMQEALPGASARQIRPAPQWMLLHGSTRNSNSLELLIASGNEQIITFNWGIVWIAQQFRSDISGNFILSGQINNLSKKCSILSGPIRRISSSYHLFFLNFTE